MPEYVQKRPALSVAPCLGGEGHLPPPPPSNSDGGNKRKLELALTSMLANNPRGPWPKQIQGVEWNFFISTHKKTNIVKTQQEETIRLSKCVLVRYSTSATWTGILPFLLSNLTCRRSQFIQG